MASRRETRLGSSRRRGLLEERPTTNTNPTQDVSPNPKPQEASLKPLTSYVGPEESDRSSRYSHRDYNPPSEPIPEAVGSEYLQDPVTKKDRFFPNHPEEHCVMFGCDKFAPHTHENGFGAEEVHSPDESYYRKAYEALASAATDELLRSRPAPAYSTRMRISGYVPKPSRKAQEASQAKQQELKHKGGIVKCNSKSTSTAKSASATKSTSTTRSASTTQTDKQPRKESYKIPNTRPTASLVNPLVEIERKLSKQAAKKVEVPSLESAMQKATRSAIFSPPFVSRRPPGRLGGSPKPVPLVKKKQIDATVVGEVKQVPGLLERLEKAKQDREDEMAE